MFLAFLAWLLSASTAHGEERIDVLLLSGRNNHDWKATTPALERVLETTGRFRVTVLEETETLSAPLLAPFEVVVSNFNTFVRRGEPESDPGWPAAAKEALLEFVRSGKGHVAVHAGSSSFYDWPEYQRMVLGNFLSGRTSHGRRHEFTVNIAPESHPITQGVSDLPAFDELWHKTRFEGDVTVLATAFSSTESGGSGESEPVAAAGRFGRGRSFFLVLGHDVRAIASPAFRVLFPRGTEWAATGEVTLPLLAEERSRVRRAGESGERLGWEQAPGSLTLTSDGRPVWRFDHGAAHGKPHFDPLGPVGGPSVTWSAPPDHPWHYGLWFSWKYLNGVNYWEEDPRTHRGEGRTTVTSLVRDPRPDGSARIEMGISYHLAAEFPAAAVLKERRTIRVSAPREDGSYHIDWSAVHTACGAEVLLERTPPPGEPGGKAYGGYAGLSLRMQSLARRRVISTEGAVAFNDEDRFRGRAAALDYSGELGGEIGGIAIVDHPENPGSPSPWYAIRSSSMSFFSPALLCFEPRTLRQGESLALRYRIILHRGRWTPERLRKACDTFVTGTSRGAGE